MPTSQGILPTQTSSLMALSKGKQSSLASSTLLSSSTPTRSEFTRDHTKVSPVALVSPFQQTPWNHSACSKTKLRESTCHKSSTFTSIPKTRPLVSTGPLILNKHQPTRVHSCNGALLPPTLSTLREIFCNRDSHQLMLLSSTALVWAGDMTWCIQTNCGIPERITKIISSGRGKLSQRLTMTDQKLMHSTNVPDIDGDH